MEENLTLFLKDYENKDISLLSPLVLAYIGDAVYELVIRTKSVSFGNRSVNILHRDSTKFVKASTQAILGKLIKDELNDEELAVYKRGRNAKSHSMAKNASMSDYRYATAFEALLGYIYLNKDIERLMYLVEKAIILFKVETMSEKESEKN